MVLRLELLAPAPAPELRIAPLPVTVNSRAEVSPDGRSSWTTFVSRFVPFRRMSSSTGGCVQESKQHIPTSLPTRRSGVFVGTAGRAPS